MPDAVLDFWNVAAQCGQWEQPVCRLWDGKVSESRGE